MVTETDGFPSAHFLDLFPPWLAHVQIRVTVWFAKKDSMLREADDFFMYIYRIKYGRKILACQESVLGLCHLRR